MLRSDPWCVFTETILFSTEKSLIACTIFFFLCMCCLTTFAQIQQPHLWSSFICQKKKKPNCDGGFKIIFRMQVKYYCIHQLTAYFSVLCKWKWMFNSCVKREISLLSVMEINPKYWNAQLFLIIQNIQKNETGQNPEGWFYSFWWTHPGIEHSNYITASAGATARRCKIK